MVVAGLDPAIHHTKGMDARVKPGHDSRDVDGAAKRLPLR
jgi:hypothetical protein